MLPSFHDQHVVGYEILCEVREIRLHIKEALEGAVGAAVSTVVFAGVEGYQF